MVKHVQALCQLYLVIPRCYSSSSDVTKWGSQFTTFTLDSIDLCTTNSSSQLEIRVESDFLHAYSTLALLIVWFLHEYLKSCWYRLRFFWVSNSPPSHLPVPLSQLVQPCPTYETTLETLSPLCVDEVIQVWCRLVSIWWYTSRIGDVEQVSKWTPQFGTVTVPLLCHFSWQLLSGMMQHLHEHGQGQRLVTFRHLVLTKFLCSLGTPTVFRNHSRIQSKILQTKSVFSFPWIDLVQTTLRSFSTHMEINYFVLGSLPFIVFRWSMMYLSVPILVLILSLLAPSTPCTNRLSACHPPLPSSSLPPLASRQEVFRIWELSFMIWRCYSSTLDSFGPKLNPQLWYSYHHHYHLHPTSIPIKPVMTIHVYDVVKHVQALCQLYLVIPRCYSSSSDVTKWGSQFTTFTLDSIDLCTTNSSSQLEIRVESDFLHAYSTLLMRLLYEIAEPLVTTLCLQLIVHNYARLSLLRSSFLSSCLCLFPLHKRCRLLQLRSLL